LTKFERFEFYKSKFFILNENELNYEFKNIISNIFPNDVLFEIIKYLDLETIIFKIRFVSKHLNSIIFENSIWENFCLNKIN
jgi:hypothetical protein